MTLDIAVPQNVYLARQILSRKTLLSTLMINEIIASLAKTDKKVIYLDDLSDEELKRLKKNLKNYVS